MYRTFLHAGSRHKFALNRCKRTGRELVFLITEFVTLLLWNRGLTREWRERLNLAPHVR
jgi:hypothetical protein